MSNFPGPLKDPKNPIIDQFPNLIDSASNTNLRPDQIVKASYYNSMVSSLESTWNYITFLEGETSRPTTSELFTSVSGNTELGEIKVTTITQPIVYSFALKDIIGLYSSSHKTSISGSMLPFEFVITPDKQSHYKNHPLPNLIIEDSKVYDYSKTGMINIGLSPFNTDFEFNSILYANYIRYPQGYYNDLSTIWSITDGPNEVIIKGFIVDNAAWYTTSSTVPGLSQWESLGSSITLNLCIVGIN